jgi:hypothetical protein
VVEDRPGELVVTLEAPTGDDAVDLPCAAAPGGEVWFALPLPSRSRVVVAAEDRDGRAAAALAAFSSCAEGVLGCVGAANATPLVLPDVEAGTVFVAVEDAPDLVWPVTVRAQVESLVRACNNGQDDDGDALIDVLDPGCAFGLDDDEAHDPSALPECANGLDDDVDGAADYPADPQCRFAGTVTEAPSCERDVPTSRVDALEALEARLTLRTSGPNLYETSCGAGSRGPEQVVVLTLAERSDVTLRVENNDYDTVLFVRRACDDAATEVGCNDDFNGLASGLDLQGLEAGDYFVFLDGYDRGAGGADVVIRVTPTPPNGDRP